MPDAASKERGLTHIAVIIILVLGIIVGVYLVQKTQIFKPKAFSNAGQAVEVIPGDSDTPLPYDEPSNSFKTNSRSVQIKLNPAVLEELKKVE